MSEYSLRIPDADKVLREIPDFSRGRYLKGNGRPLLEEDGELCPPKWKPKGNKKPPSKKEED